MECNGEGAKPPTTLAEVTLGTNSQDYYDVSLVDGFNLLMVGVSGGSGPCAPTGCSDDLNQKCLAELRSEGGRSCRNELQELIDNGLGDNYPFEAAVAIANLAWTCVEKL
nr:thaumatin-like protein 1 [Ipomoea batatas]